MDAEKDEVLWTRLAERWIPRPDEIKVEYDYLLGQHKIVVIAEAPDETSIAKSHPRLGRHR